jgi:hypothetical protein
MKSASSRSSGFISFDGLFSIIPALLILVFTMNAAHFLTKDAIESMHRQQVFDKLVSIGDYVVKQGAVKTGKVGAASGNIPIPIDEVRYPNWVVKSKLDSMDTDKLRQAMNLSALSISLGKPGDGSVCIYRIVLDEQKEIKRLYVCGD